MTKKGDNTMPPRVQHQIRYRWRLREIMAARGMHYLSDLLPHLRAVGIELSDSQFYRLLNATPDRLPLALLGALCHALDCTADELCVFELVTGVAVPVGDFPYSKPGNVFGLDREPCKQSMEMSRSPEVVTPITT
jgi:DNA-binding Xre family transcriptional regulator